MAPSVLPDLLSVGAGTSLIQVAGILLLAWYAIATFIAWHRLRHIPGPPLAGISSFWIVWHTLLGDVGPACQALGRRYPGAPLVRTAPNVLVTSNPGVLRHLVSSRPGGAGASPYSRSTWWSNFKPGGAEGTNNLLTELGARPHDRLKAKLSAGYAGRDGVDIEGTVNAQLARLKAIFRRNLASPGDELRAVDLGRLTMFFTLDVITALGYGKPFGWLDGDGEDLFGMVADGDRFIYLSSLTVEVPWLRRLFNPNGGLLGRLMPRFTDKSGLGKAMGTARDIIFSRFDGDQKHHADMFGSFMRNGTSREECASESFVHITAGSETTATVIRTTMLMLLTTPRVYGKLKAEIRDALASGTAGGSGAPITSDEARRLPYLQAVIWEGFRMRPPVIFGHYKAVPASGDVVAGVHVPAGTHIGHNSIAMMRDEGIFGRDVEVFRPERWLECDEGARQAMDRAVDVVFGAGRWMCAGKPVALVELNKTYFELLRDFDFQVLNPNKPWIEDSFIIWRHNNFMVRITEAE